MTFLENIFQRLSRAAAKPVLQEVRGSEIVSSNGGELLARIHRARVFLRKAGLKKGDRCALIAPNSINWAAVDLAIMAEGGIVVPLYHRQAPTELVTMMRDSSPAFLICGDKKLRELILQVYSDAPPVSLIEDVIAGASNSDPTQPSTLTDSDPVTIIYTSGTSGEPKGVVLTVGNVNHMLRCTTGRLDALMGTRSEPDRVFHYLYFCFAGSWILLLSCLSRNSMLTLSTDISRVADEMRLAAPNYLLNVPLMLERIRGKIEQQLQEKGGLALSIFQRAESASLGNGSVRSIGDSVSLRVANTLIFPTIRKKLGPNLKAMICGSAPLAKETQLFYEMLGIPVLQVYGLTETTAICTMDIPGDVEPGRVGPAIDEVEMRLGEHDEILVRGPNIFPGYWNRPGATQDVIRDGWFHTGDQGEVDGGGKWRITGRLKNLIVPASGHNVAPEPIEEAIQLSLPAAQQVMLVGSGRSHLSAIITGEVRNNDVEAVLQKINANLPHYKRVHAFFLCKEPFTVEGGLLTANGKLKRDAITARFSTQIESLYQQPV